VIKWGIIGTGKIAYDVGFAIQAQASCQMVAVGSRKIENAEKYARRLKLTAYYDDYDRVLGRDDVDIVYIATPNALHADLIEKALRQGKHVLCEKPMTLRAHRLRQLKELATQRRLFLMEAMWTLFLPSVRRFLSDVKQVGNIRLIRGSMGFPLAKERCFRKDLGGGCIFDLGVYLVSLTYAVLGTPDQFYAQKISRRGDVETSATISLQYGRTALADLLCSYDAHLENTFSVYGDKGALTLEAPFFRSAMLSFRKYGPVNESTDAVRNPFDAFSVLKNAASWKQRLYHRFHLGKRHKIVPFEANGYQYQIREVVKCLETNQIESAILPVEHSARVIGILDKLITV